jgi:hypothetical protein
MNKFVFVLLSLTALPALAQHAAPYAGQQAREIKALSPDEVNQYLAGAGMGYARAAELNGYPGPMHVLEHADALKLSDVQREATVKLMQTHKAEARDIGARRIAAEKKLDALFRAGGAEEGLLAQAVREAAAVEGEYRLSHLETHRRMRLLLTDAQIARYDHLRGYAQDAQPSHKH